MCVTIQGQTATSHQPFHPDLCVSLSRGRLPPVINHSTLTYVCHYPGADCHQSSTIPPWPWSLGPRRPWLASPAMRLGGSHAPISPRMHPKHALSLNYKPLSHGISIVFGYPMRPCRLWGINKYAHESACDCQMVVTDKGFLLGPVDRPHWIFRGRIGSKKVRPICGDLW